MIGGDNFMDDVCPICGEYGIYFDAGRGCYYCPNCNNAIGKSYYRFSIIRYYITNKSKILSC